MSKGLKQSVAEALSTQEAKSKQDETPVEVSAEAVRALTDRMREWSGWSDAVLIFGQPETSRFADCNHVTHTFTVKPEPLVLNPNRVLLTVTPFRLRQEAVLTGTLLHEAGHARHTHWLPRKEGDAPLLHSDGTAPSRQVVALARLMEEPRVEALQARDENRIGATGLGWTMRAHAAHLIPTTVLNLINPGQQVMDLITSWSLRAGRQIGLNHWLGTAHPLRNWVSEFTNLLHQRLVIHLSTLDHEDPQSAAIDVVSLLRAMIINEDDTGPTMIDLAKRVTDLLFPETDGDEDGAPMPGMGCEGQSQPQPSEEKSEAQGDEGTGDEPDSEDGEGNSEPEDEGSGDDPGAGDSGEDEEGEPEKSGGTGEGESDESEGDESEGDESEGDESEGDESDEGEGESGATSSTGPVEEADSELARALAALEKQAADDTGEEVEEEKSETPPVDSPGSGAGAGSGHADNPGWRTPVKNEREFQKGAERFLRDLIAPNESAKVVLTESPSATVDGAALAAWKAGGQGRDPRFFKRTRREVEPSPPVKIAILVDVSSSMSALQKPSALLSWALAAAALDLRNYAGRGQQIESTLIHWGNEARVIQPNGAPLPGIKEFPCAEGTHAMGPALALVEEQIPGFFDITDKPVNRLLVQFTDWELFGAARIEKDWISRALEAGVNMLSVVPRNFSPRRSDYESILRDAKVQRGSTSLVKYDPTFPEHVWDEAAKALA